MDKKKKKVYEKPTFKEEEVFEKTSLACAKLDISAVCEIGGSFVS